jgi:hypothetical protein
MGGGLGGGSIGGVGGKNPGSISPFDAGVASQALGQNQQMIQNRYSQLGLSGNPQGPGGGSPVAAAKAGVSLTSGGAPTTAESMDLQGAELQNQALLGQMQLANLAQPSGAGGKGGGLGGLGGLGALAGI